MRCWGHTVGATRLCRTLRFCCRQWRSTEWRRARFHWPGMCIRETTIPLFSGARVGDLGAKGAMSESCGLSEQGWQEVAELGGVNHLSPHSKNTKSDKLKTVCFLDPSF